MAGAAEVVTSLQARHESFTLRGANLDPACAKVRRSVDSGFTQAVRAIVAVNTEHPSSPGDGQGCGEARDLCRGPFRNRDSRFSMSGAFRDCRRAKLDQQRAAAHPAGFPGRVAPGRESAFGLGTRGRATMDRSRRRHHHGKVHQ
jgi:hypothetical protein